MRVSIAVIIMVVAAFFTSCNDQKRSNKKQESTENPIVKNSTDAELMDKIQRQTFNYFWEGAEPVSGLARERIHMDNVYPDHDQNIITTGGSGFGLMAILVGVERGFITQEQAGERFLQILDFLEEADRFHGAWPHWLKPDGTTAPFSKKDDGGDLVEAAFLVQGLLTVKEFFDRHGTTDAERSIGRRIQILWEEVEWNWYTKGGEKVLYWHWSPKYGWDMNFPIVGYNEALVMYILAAASPTHPIDKETYDEGWAANGEITDSRTHYGLETELNHYGDGKSHVGPLFWAHYSYLGLNPNGLKDQYGDYWKLNRNHTLIHYKHAVANPNNFKGYGENVWGQSSSYSMKGYSAHRPDDDLGVITPTAALSSMPYTPEESMRFLRYMYEEQDSLIGKYGPYDAFSFEHDWSVPRYLAIDQGPIPVMIENYRSGMLWKLFMNNKDVQNGLKKLGFESN